MKEISNEEKSVLREKFIREYSRIKNWDPMNLTSKQMLEIISQDPYKNPKIK